jgi:hypothetical protein
MKDLDIKDSTIGILDSAKFRQLLNVVGDNVSVELESDSKNPDRITSLTLSDDKSEVYLMAGDLDVFPPEPKLKSVPPFEVEIKLTDEFIERFSKSLSATGLEVFTLVMNKKTSDLQFVLGHGRNNSNRISLNVECIADKNTVKAPISFSAKTLKEILSANSEVKDLVLKVSDAGIALIEASKDGFQSQYYMIKIEIED